MKGKKTQRKRKLVNAAQSNVWRTTGERKQSRLPLIAMCDDVFVCSAHQLIPVRCMLE